LLIIYNVLVVLPVSPLCVSAASTQRLSIACIPSEMRPRRDAGRHEHISSTEHGNPDRIAASHLRRIN
ncbi:MAG: hypothetical protein LBD27_00280, partial [Tannerella sp.]|nr:hypothetical protein [Tannerella sp.]